MPIDQTRIRQHLTESNFKKLFIEELGWDRHDGSLDVRVDGTTYTLRAVAQKRGVQIFECPVSDHGVVPDYATRKKIDRQVTKSAHEHLIIFTDRSKSLQIWQWVARQVGKATAYREYPFTKGQSGDIIIQKLHQIAFSLDEEEGLSVIEGVIRLRDAFDKDRVTRKFYDLFKKEHDGFLKFIEGIPAESLERWYASVMINRLMFIYFIQKKGFLNYDVDYLKNELLESKRRGKDRFYKDFLCPLFFEGFARKEEERSAKINQLLGKIPYLNGGLFLKHQIEELHGKQIEIPDKAFDKLFAFFDEYEWHLDDRPIAKGNEINPDVLGYIFEKYINQKELGAYYTKEDITGYISKNTVIPYLFDVAKKECKIAFEGEHSVWRLLQNDPDRYIYEAVRRGVILEDGSVLPETKLPDFVQKGMDNPKARMFEKRYNLGEAQLFDEHGKKLTLPTETWREYVERRKRCLELRDKLKAGEIHDINDLITYNLNITQFAQDVIDNCEGPDLLNAFWKAINKVTVLDPTCGSGAFLFAALNILEPLYEACLQRMEAFINEWGDDGKKKHPNYYKFFSETLKRVEDHPNTKYFIYKSIIINNLFGVDILEEAVEICKLRLFLKLVAQVEVGQKIEALPDIDFNIRSGNTLVGYATIDEVEKHLRIRAGSGEGTRAPSAGEKGVQAGFDFEEQVERTLELVRERAEEVNRLFGLFRQQQTRLGGEVTQEDKQELRKRLKGLDDELNRYLASECGVDSKISAAYEKWVNSHKPFHWLAEYYATIAHGGFDVVIGNPPYVEYDSDLQQQYTIRYYQTLECGNLHAYIVERSQTVVSHLGRCGFIVPLPSVSTARMQKLQRLIKPKRDGKSRSLWVSAFDERPSNLFSGVDQRLIIEIFGSLGQYSSLATTGINRWASRTREYLFPKLSYAIQSDDSVKLSTSILKIGDSVIEGKLLQSLYSNDPIGNYRSKAVTSDKLAYRTAGGRYWKVVSNKPFDSGTLSGKVAYFNGLAGDLAAALVSSSTFWWYYSSHFDMYNLKDYMIFGFRFSKWGKENAQSLADLGKRLVKSLEENAEIHQVESKTRGTVESKVYVASRSKPIIDKIDRVLAQHYGFTDEELDFIVNYDIKYRMGRDAGEEE